MDEYESPYCDKCSGCGEDGCCSYLTCFSALIKDSKCEYGGTYLKSAVMDRKILGLSYEIFEKLEEKTITAEQAVVEFNSGCSKIFDDIYRSNEDIEKKD